MSVRDVRLMQWQLMLLSRVSVTQVSSSGRRGFGSLQFFNGMVGTVPSKALTPSQL